MPPKANPDQNSQKSGQKQQQSNLDLASRAFAGLVVQRRPNYENNMSYDQYDAYDKAVRRERAEPSRTQHNRGSTQPSSTSGGAGTAKSSTPSQRK